MDKGNELKVEKLSGKREAAMTGWSDVQWNGWLVILNQPSIEGSVLSHRQLGAPSRIVDPNYCGSSSSWGRVYDDGDKIH